MVNIDVLIETARHNAAVSSFPQYVRGFADRWGRPYPVVPYHPEWYAPGGTDLGSVLDMRDAFVVYPTSLVLPVDSVNWMWECPHPRYAHRLLYKQGTALQAERWCRRHAVGTNLVYAVPAERVHGTAVFVPGPRFPTDKLDWRMVVTESF